MTEQRDLQKDLEMCERATEGPWAHGKAAFGYCSIYQNLPNWNGMGRQMIATVATPSGANYAEDIAFIAESRTALPHALRRAIEAEAEIERLRGLLNGSSITVNMPDGSRQNYRLNIELVSGYDVPKGGSDDA